MSRALTTVIALLAAACQAGEGTPPAADTAGGDGGSDAADAADDTADADAGPPPLEPLFSFAVVADPHVTGGGDHAARLSAAVDWINAQAAERSIELVLVVGDIAWGAGLATAPDLLSPLTMPWVPINGDNEIEVDQEEPFHAAFAPQWERLAGELAGWSKAPVPVDFPGAGQRWLVNLAFDHGGVHFQGLDWCARGVGGLAAEMGDLHDFEGGTWPWWEADLAAHAEGPDDGIVLFTHIPMHLGAFDAEETTRIHALLEPYSARVHAVYAGHVHRTYELVGEGPLDVYVTDATHDDENTVRVVTVSGNGLELTYAQDLVVVE